jgi:hypothetical protein
MFVVASRLAFPTPPIEIHIEAQKATFTPKMYCSSLSFLPATIGASFGRVLGKVLPYREEFHSSPAYSRFASSATLLSGPFPPATPTLVPVRFANKNAEKTVR